MRWGSSVIGPTFPRYRGLAPPWEGRVVCDRAPLSDLANRVVALDRKSPAPVKLVFSSAGIDFTAKSPVGMVSGYLEVEHAALPDECDGPVQLAVLGRCSCQPDLR